MLKIEYLTRYLGRIVLRAFEKHARNGIRYLILPLFFLASLSSSMFLRNNQDQPLLKISQIQGSGPVSPLLDQRVNFRGIVTGIREDQNLQGVRYYTLFVQDLPESKDAARSTSDGIAVFHGRKKPNISQGDIVNITGLVTEYYGLTEIDDKGLRITVEEHEHPLPDAIELDPPANYDRAVSYFERLEGMLVRIRSAVVVGPTHEGCGFAVVKDGGGKYRIMKHNRDANTGQIVNILNRTDVNCDDFPNVEVGYHVNGLQGPLTYDFEQYKLVHQNNEYLGIERARENILGIQDLRIKEDEIVLATFNLNNYFDSRSDTGDPAEPVVSATDVELKQKKLSFVIADILSCPAVLGVQEVEKASILEELAFRLESECKFKYAVSHLDTADQRGADVALLSDPRRVNIKSLEQHQACTTIETGIIDPLADCPAGTSPLFSRQPLQIDLTIDQLPVSVFVVHFKSKRGGEAETEPRRLAQATTLKQIVQKLNSEGRSQNVIVMGDINDYYKSPTMQILTEDGLLEDHFASLPEDQRYSYIFDGASQLIDAILVSHSLMDKVTGSVIYHVNADYPSSYAKSLNDEKIGLRSSDHDIPAVVLRPIDSTSNNLAGSNELESALIEETRLAEIKAPTTLGLAEDRGIEHAQEGINLPDVTPSKPFEIHMEATAPEISSKPTASLFVDDTNSEVVDTDQDPSIQSGFPDSVIVWLVLIFIVSLGIGLGRTMWRNR